MKPKVTVIVPVYNAEMLNKNPKEVFTNYVLKHYDFPREGSLTWQATHGGKE